MVEDESLIALVESRSLRKNGYRVTTTSDPEDAIKKAIAETPDLVLMDIDLGCEEMDGTDAAERILDRCDLPVVFLTSHTEKEYVDRARQITRYGYVVKDSGEFVLIQSVETALELFQAHKDLSENYAELSAVYEQTPVLMVVLDSERRIRRANAAMAEFTNTELEALTGMRPGEALRCLRHLDDPRGCGFGPQCDHCAVRRAALTTIDTRRTQRRVEATLPLVRDGKIRNRTLWVSAAYFEIEGTPRVVVSIEDGSLIKQHESEASECLSRFTACYRSFPAIMYSVDGEGRIISVNEEWLHTFGYTREEVIGNEFAGFVAEESRQLVVQTAVPEICDDKPVYELPCRFLKKNGDSFDGTLSAISACNEEGKVVRTHAVVRPSSG